MAALKPITLYGHSAGANPYKVLIVLHELGLPFETIPLSNPKEEWFAKINPNGRVPAIVDPNTDLTLWESGAIVEYLVDTYDKEGKLKGETTNDNWLIKQYLHFQMSGQGPYYGQAVWFTKFHSEDLPSAKTRYIEQVVRVFEVLENILKDKDYLVGGKVTYADIAWIPWNAAALHPDYLRGVLIEQYDLENKYPNVFAWHKRLLERPSVKAAFKGTLYES